LGRYIKRGRIKKIDRERTLAKGKIVGIAEGYWPSAKGIKAALILRAGHLSLLVSDCLSAFTEKH